MSRSRHEAKHRAKGGKVVAYAGGESNVMKEAHERKRGGRVHGEGEKMHHRMDRKRARGGAVGADKRPMSSAANIKMVTKGESKEDMGKH